jgi:hypothetical protein
MLLRASREYCPHEQIHGKFTLYVGRSHARRLRRPLGPRFLAAFVPLILTRIEQRRRRRRDRFLCFLPLVCRPRISSLPETSQKIRPGRCWRPWDRAVPLEGRKCRPSVGPLGQLAKNRLSDNAGAVNHFLSVLLRALRRARHFALVEAFAFVLPTKAHS